MPNWVQVKFLAVYKAEIPNKVENIHKANTKELDNSNQNGKDDIREPLMKRDAKKSLTTHNLKDGDPVFAEDDDLSSWNITSNHN